MSRLAFCCSCLALGLLVLPSAPPRSQPETDRGYWTIRSGSRLEAPNPRQGFRTFFAADRIRVFEHASRGDAALVDLALRRVGRAGALEAVPAGRVRSDHSRVEIRRPGLVEWFENSPAGLEHGFTLEERPGGSGILRFELALSGARAENGSEGIRFVTRSGQRLDYGALETWDATGRPLGAQFQLAAVDRLFIEVDDAEARYPITIDPLLTWTSDTTLRGDRTSITFGFQIASEADVNGDGYDDLIVGAPNYDAPGLPGAGAAFLFLGSAQGIPSGSIDSANAVLVGDQEGGGMGDAVAPAGDVNGDGFDDVLIAASGYDGAHTQDEDTGRVYLFLGRAGGIPSGGTASASALLTGSVGGAFFGASVARAGDVNGDGFDDVVIGAPEWQNNGATLQEGAAFVFHGSVSGIASGTEASADTRIEGNRSVVGLGRSVASAGDVNGDGFDDVIVGCPGYGFDQARDGAAFVYLGSSAGIPSGNPATANTRLDGDHSLQPLGRYVASAGDVNGDGFDDVIVGAPEYYAGQIREGAAFVFLGSASGIPHAESGAAHARLESNQENAAMGRVSPAGNVNGDLFADVLVSAAAYDAGETDEGASFVHLGSPAGISSGNPQTAFAVLEGSQDGADFGASLASGDVNGDGRSDVVVGADRLDLGESDEGAALAFLGSSFADNCPFFASADATDTDGDARGNPCECTDQNGDGRNTVSDLVAINLAIFNPGLVTPLCDGNNDGFCNVADVIAANTEIFSPANTSTCARQPLPGP